MGEKAIFLAAGIARPGATARSDWVQVLAKALLPGGCISEVMWISDAGEQVGPRPAEDFRSALFELPGGSLFTYMKFGGNQICIGLEVVGEFSVTSISFPADDFEEVNAKTKQFLAHLLELAAEEFGEAVAAYGPELDVSSVENVPVCTILGAAARFASDDRCRLVGTLLTRLT